MRRSSSRTLLKDLVKDLVLKIKKSNSHNSLKQLTDKTSSEIEEPHIKKDLYFSLKRGFNKEVIPSYEEEETILDNIIEPVSYECGNKLTDYVEDGHQVNIFGDDYPLRNALLLLLYTTFRTMKDVPRVLKKNENHINISLMVEFCAPLVINSLMKSLIGVGIHEFLNHIIYKLH